VAKLDKSSEKLLAGQRVESKRKGGDSRMSPQEIILEAQKLSLAEQEAIATQLTYNLLGEMQALGFQEA
jgi:hypothetical protein